MSTRPSDLVAKLRGGRLLVALLVGVALLAAIGRTLTGVYVEILWQAQAGYLSVYWRRVLWEWGVRSAAGLVVVGLVFVNLRVASATLGGIQIRRRFGNLEISEQIPRRWVTLALASSSALIGLWFGASVPRAIGRQALLAASASAWGVQDPFLGRDLGFYVFWFPVLGSAITYAMIVAFLVFTLATAGYAATGALSWTRGHFRSHGLARKHLGGILAAFFLLLALRLWLGRYELLLDGSSAVQGIFGFTDEQARLPALQTLAVLSLIAAAATAWGAVRNRVWPLLASTSSVIVGTILIGNVYPYFIQSFRVEPNELERETPYIVQSLDFTRRGFGLDQTERRDFDYDAAAPIDWELASRQFAGLPVWGSEPLRTAYRQEQARFGYYDFDRVAIDRYPTEAGPIPVALAVRQIETRGIQDPNWQNLHLRERYVAGMGAVASLANVRTERGRVPMLLAGIPPVAEDVPGAPRLELTRPEIFFGTRPQREYAVVTPGPDPYLAPDSSQGAAGVDFPEGIQLSSAVRKALLAWHFRTANLLFSSEVHDESRLIHRRQVIERAVAIAPFLRFPELPYPIIHEGRVVWMLEGFTGTLAFPLSAVHDLGTVRRAVRYVRNSVKVTVDAVTGDIAFYRVPIEDPLADAYETAYPGLLRPMEEMPAALREHLRYPRSLLDLQAQVLLQYHQDTAPVFHGQRDVWQVAQEQATNTTPTFPYEAEYGIYRLPGESEPRFQLTTLFVPVERENLTAIFVGRTDDAGRPESILLDVPVADEVPGPRLVEPRVEQDPVISSQFSLWRQAGSEVWTGHLHLVPVGGRFLYMEPVFLAASEDAVPELARFAVSDGRRVVMTETLSAAVAALAGADVPGAPSGQAPPTPSGAGGAWSEEALTLLDRAEASARAGDWSGFGAALDELRTLLERANGAGG